jgi:type VI secretion system protein VasD
VNAMPWCLRFVYCGVFALACGCASKPPPPTVAELEVVVGSDVNPDSSGRPSPVIVWMYELKSLAAFNAASSTSLRERESAKKELGGDLVAREELPLQPGQRLQMTKTLQAETRFLGVTAEFRDDQHARWRSTTAIPANKLTPLQIRLDANDVSVTAR